MTFSFPYTGSCFPLVFVAWIPLLLLESYYAVGKKSHGLFFQAYLTFFIYNLGTTWWIYYASPEGAYMAFICNSLVMAIAFYVFHRLKRKLGNHWMGLLLICTWLSFEFIHFGWELSWPWLTLGNSFADVPILVQWYAWTGVLGGSLWILGVNVFLTQFIQRKAFIKVNWAQNKRFIGRGMLIVFAPIFISLFLYSITSTTKSNPYEVVIIQPNIDPYTSKFDVSDQEQLIDIMELADKKVSLATQLVLAPETALSPNAGLEEEAIYQNTLFHTLMERRARWHDASFLIGASTYRFFEQKNSRASKPLRDGPGFYESYNTSILFTQNRQPTIIHKSKLVLGVEKIPFSNWLPWLEELSINLDGTSGTLGIEDKGPSCMTHNSVKFAPVVCYESIYGNFVRRQCKQGAQFIAIITNDGWWRNTPGYKQHFAFARLRAIENRKYVVRSANTGKSGVINNRGDVVHELGWWKKGSLKATIQLNKKTTVYQLLGDWIGYLAVAGFVVFLGMRGLKRRGI